MAKKRKTDNEIIEEVIAQAAPAPVLESLPEEVIDEIVAAPVIEVAKGDRIPGMYYQGVRILKTLTNLGKKWNVLLVDGRRLKINKSDIELVK